MTDQFDRAQALELDEWERRQRDAIQPAPERESAEQCAACGEPIPEARRLAVPGARLCVECQRAYEKLYWT